MQMLEKDLLVELAMLEENLVPSLPSYASAAQKLGLAQLGARVTAALKQESIWLQLQQNKQVSASTGHIWQILLLQCACYLRCGATAGRRGILLSTAGAGALSCFGHARQGVCVPLRTTLQLLQQLQPLCQGDRMHCVKQ